MYNNTIIENGNELKKCLAEKNKLKQIHFFNDNHLNHLFEILEFHNQLKSYLSTLTINENYIKATFRKTYFKKYRVELYSSTLIKIIFVLMKQYKHLLIYLHLRIQIRCILLIPYK